MPAHAKMMRLASLEYFLLSLSEVSFLTSRATAPDGRQRRLLLHEPVRHCLGQRGNGKLLPSRKNKRAKRKIYRSRNKAKADVFDYMERYFKDIRHHSTIGYLSPVEFEREVGLA